MAPDRTRHGRRRFLQGSLALAGLGLLSGCGRLPPQAQQSAKVSRVGWLMTDPAGAAAVAAEGFRQELGELGYVERDGRVVLFRRPPAWGAAVLPRERADRADGADDERAVFPDAERGRLGGEYP